MQQKRYISIDLKSFYASAECVDRGLDPLKAKLVVADASRTDKTICLAVSPALKAYGIPGRARLFEVKQKLAEHRAKTGENVEFLTAPPRMRRYMELSSDIYSIYLKYIAPEDILIYSIDEVFIDAGAYLNTYKTTAHRLAVTMIHDILAQTGITATAGIGTNLYLAKIAMDIVAKHIPADKDGVRIAELDEDGYKRMLWAHRPITDFWRVGRGTAARLEKYGIYTMGDIARVSLRDETLFYNEFGIDAELLIDHAWGIEPTLMSDIKAYKPSVNSLGSGQVLSCPYDHKKARVIVFEMTDELVLELVSKEMVTNSVTLDIGYDRESVDSGFYRGKVHIDRYGRSVPEGAHGTAKMDSYTSSSAEIINRVLALYDRITDKELTVRRITVTANNIINEGEAMHQLDIFTDIRSLEKEKRIQKATLALKSKFGKNAVLRGTSLSEGATARLRNGQVGGHKA